MYINDTNIPETDEELADNFNYPRSLEYSMNVAEVERTVRVTRPFWDFLYLSEWEYEKKYGKHPIMGK